MQNAELIITESNINDANEKLDIIEKCPLNVLYRNLCWFYQELFRLNKKVVSLILPAYNGRVKIINQIHRKLCKNYGFNIIDMHEYYDRLGLLGFWCEVDGDHPNAFIMRQLAKNIINSMSSFKNPKLDSNSLEIPQNVHFKVITPKDLESNMHLESRLLENSAFSETAYKINDSSLLKFPREFSGYYPVAIHTWNNKNGQLMSIDKNFCEASINYSCILFSNKTTSLSKECCFLNTTLECNYTNAFCIDEESFISFDSKDCAEHKELQFLIHCWFSTNANTNQQVKIKPIKSGHLDLIGILLASGNVSFMEVDFDKLENENINIAQDYDFATLIPPVEEYKEMIEKYCEVMDSKKFNAQLQNANFQIAELQRAYNSLLNEANNRLNLAQNHINMQNAKILELQNRS